MRLFTSIKEVDEIVWNTVIPEDNFFLKWEYLNAFEKNRPQNLSFHYALISDGDKSIAAFYFQVVYLTSEQIAFILEPITSSSRLNAVGNGLREWIKKCKEENGFRLLVSGNNFISGEYGVGMLKSAEPEKVFLALAETIKVITKTERAVGKISAILVKDYFEKQSKETSDFIRRKRYYRFSVEPEMIVKLAPEWKSFENYLESFSKKYRNRAKSVLKKTSEIKVVELNGEALEQNASKLFQLYYNVFEKAKFRLSVLSPEYFVDMKNAFPDKFFIYAYELNGKIVGFRSGFHLSTHLEAHFIGIDYSVNADIPLYQRVLYDFIKDGIESQLPEVFLGRTAAEMKSTVGATAENLVCYIRHRNGLSNQVIRPFIDYLKPSEWVPRNPFKEE